MGPSAGGGGPYDEALSETQNLQLNLLATHNDIVEELKLMGIPVPLLQEADLEPMSFADIDAAISKATAPALMKQAQVSQTPDWDEHQRALLEEADPDVDHSDMSPKELILLTEVHGLEGVVKRLRADNKRLETQAAADRADWDKMHAQCSKYAEENHRVLELLGEADTEAGFEKFHIEKVNKTVLLSKAEEEEQHARYAEEAYEKAAAEAKSAMDAADKEREEADRAAQEARKEQEEAEEAERDAKQELREAAEAEERAREAEERVRTFESNPGKFKAGTADYHRALEKLKAEAKTSRAKAAKERAEADHAAMVAQKEREEANDASAKAYREMEEAMKAAADRDAAISAQSLAQGKADHERDKAERSRQAYVAAGGHHVIEADQVSAGLTEGEIQLKRRLGGFSGKTASARLSLRRAVNKVTMENAFLIDKMTGATVVIPPKSLKWARALIQELLEAKCKADNAFLIQLRGSQDQNPDQLGALFLPQPTPTVDEVCFWRPPEHPGLSRLPEYLYEFLQDKFGHGRTTERRLAELMATIATHGKQAADITLLMRFVSEQWEVSTLSCYLTAVSRLGHIHRSNLPGNPLGHELKLPELSLFEGKLPVSRGEEIASEAIGESWPMSRRKEFVMRLTGGRGMGDGSFEVTVDAFLEALCCEHAMCERTFRSRLEHLLSGECLTRGMVTYNEFLAVGRGAGLTLQGHTSELIKAANVIWGHVALCHNSAMRVYRQVPWEILIAALQVEKSPLTKMLRTLLQPPINVTTKAETGLRPVGDAAIMSHIRSRWHAASPGLDAALKRCKSKPQGGDGMEELERLRMRFVATINSTFGSVTTASELYSKLLYTATHVVLETGKSKEFLIDEESIKSGMASETMRNAEDMASLVLTQHDQSNQPEGKPTFTFGGDKSFKTGRDTEIGVLFGAKGTERHKRKELGDFRATTIDTIGAGQLQSHAK